MTEQTEATYTRLKIPIKRAVEEIATEEDRSVGKMINILLDIGIRTYRARQKKERRPARETDPQS